VHKSSDVDPEVPGTVSRYAIRDPGEQNDPQKLKKVNKFNSLMDVLFWGLKASPVA
jgi:hypothetical protein